MMTAERQIMFNLVTLVGAGNTMSVKMNPGVLGVFEAELAEHQRAARSEPAQLSVAEELERLAALRDTGVLTQDEFSLQKARILA